ncbi:DUF6255 family natural product biosynthesis protein [Streptomyces sp. I05A-00742]|uniref:DUF6255 family natural product biosynthesis protein n=1 Tax=Streptomyces sp. I05A-00742 TaxID=2732853 RepID=UPI0014882376|nr:DUF6255 family natural product biosynthesis protein [Streptomyces sp. I05A-00742]
MKRTVGRLVDTCRHTSGWESAGGEEQCPDCGTRRFTDYGALRPPDLPSAAPTPSPRDSARADRAAATVIARTVRHLSHWGRSRTAFWLPVATWTRGSMQG